MTPGNNVLNIERLRLALSTSTELAQIQYAMESYCAAVGIRMLGYYHYPPVGAVDFGPDIQVYAFGWPANWVETFVREGYVHVDPLPRIAARQTRPFWWSQISTLGEIHADERAYLAKAAKAGLADGLAIPVFGPNARNGYYPAAFGKDEPKPDDSEIAKIHAACQLAHLQYCELILRFLPDRVNLSERERQILSYAVRGHSNQMIATKLNISANTVDTYVRRCFDKLDVHDRVATGLRGLAMGLVA